jgi:hypothetical protein
VFSVCVRVQRLCPCSASASAPAFVFSVCVQRLCPCSASASVFNVRVQRLRPWSASVSLFSVCVRSCVLLSAFCVYVRPPLLRSAPVICALPTVLRVQHTVSAFCPQAPCSGSALRIYSASAYRFRVYFRQSAFCICVRRSTFCNPVSRSSVFCIPFPCFAELCAVRALTCVLHAAFYMLYAAHCLLQDGSCSCVSHRRTSRGFCTQCSLLRVGCCIWVLPALRCV